MQSSSSSWVGYGKLAVNAHSAPKMAIGETTQMWQILFVVSFFFLFFAFPIGFRLSECLQHAPCPRQNLAWPMYDTARPV